jgi:hypothetical protein
MLFAKLLDRFIEKTPITVMAYGTIHFALNSSLLDRLFTATATTQYERTLLFSSVVDLMSLVGAPCNGVVDPRRSGRGGV